MNFNIKKGYCCSDIKEIVEGHVDAREVPIKYIPKFRDFIVMNCSKEQHSASEQRFGRPIQYCPWCGAKFPPSLGDMYYEILDKEFPHDACEQEGVPGVCFPYEFASDAWWKKRGL